LNSWGAQAKEQLAAIAAQPNPGPQPRIPLEGNGEFHRLTDEGIQHCLRKWAVLPDNMTMAHIPLLHNFQLFLELKEASVMMLTLITTTHALLDKKAMEMKAILQAWRDRLPNPHDDIGLWNDLVSWRQHVFHTINRYYLPLLEGNGAAQAPNVNTHAHRGHHESAWIINRFAHTARKHGLLDVCHKSLNDIYKLPNIEISEAFLKLREQARCHFERPKELNSGLDVINNTNLMYFSNAQKGEFYALKGLFLHKLKMEDEANTAFGAAVQLDLNQWKPWALWGRYNDDMHQANPLNVAAGAHALSCYLQAASLARSAKVRPMLHRVLWLLSIDDSNRTIGLAWEAYKGEQVWWYWITLVPQLITSLSGREAKYAAQLLQFLSKAFPQVRDRPFLSAPSHINVFHSRSFGPCVRLRKSSVL
jgi:transformation/transcription domain-associated protein